MERRKFIRNAGAVTVVAATTGLAGCSSSGLKAGEVLHTVIFDLIHPVGSTDAGRFLKDAQKILTKIKGVHDFQVFRQNSPKNDYQYGFYMRFKSQADFDRYSMDPEHNKFVQERWEKEVSRFQESDFVTYF
ncbi:MAG: Dabb family protein [Tannerellaceae bacterium]|nr:Dabb family protein [Tannerellaceae bacterium]MCD8043606.1 Dabb family protein [Tannerellaceae bacterium]